MADVVNRDSLEAELARRFSRLSSKHRRELMSLLGNPPSYANVPQSFWQKVISELNGQFVPLLTDVYLEQAEFLVSSLPVGVDWGLINQRAVTWAQSYSYQLVQGITNTTQKLIRDAVSNFFEQSMTMGDLETIIGRAFGPVRAEMIAVTEVTRAASEAEVQIGEEMAGEGLFLDAVWKTNNDELVCPICAPLNGKKAEGYRGKRRPYWIHPTKRTEIDPPPAHPRCRCWISWEIID